MTVFHNLLSVITSLMIWSISLNLVGGENGTMKLNVTAPVFYMFCYGRLVSVIQTDMLMVLPHPHLN
jgi:hypothetical protein